MGITYKLTLAPITSEGTTGYLQSVNVLAQLTPLRTPARANLGSVEDFVTAFSDLVPNEQTKSALERLERGETVVLSEPIPREALLSMGFDFI